MTAAFVQNPEKWLLVGIIFGGLILITIITFLVIKFLPKRLKADEFARQWVNLQKLCANVETWPQAIIEADNLLDRALKKRSFRGKSMGARLVNAQRLFSDNDAVWYAHKLKVKLQQNSKRNLKQEDVKEALIGFRRALKDLGAL